MTARACGRARCRCRCWRTARAEVEPPESEYLATVAVVIPKAAEEAFLASYEQARRGVVVEVFGSRLTLGPRAAAGPRGRARSAPSQTASRAAARPSCRGPRAACSRTRTPTCSTPSPSSRSSGTPSAPPGREKRCVRRAPCLCGCACRHLPRPCAVLQLRRAGLCLLPGGLRGCAGHAGPPAERGRRDAGTAEGAGREEVSGQARGRGGTQC